MRTLHKFSFEGLKQVRLIKSPFLAWKDDVNFVFDVSADGKINMHGRDILTNPEFKTYKDLFGSDDFRHCWEILDLPKLNLPDWW
jgi:hypothetical protein